MLTTRARLERCVRDCARRAWSVAYGLLRDQHEAFDAVQQAFVVAARKPESLPAGDPWPWFGVVVAHEARNLRRKKRPRTNTRLDEEACAMPVNEGADPKNAYEGRESRERLQAALDRLPQSEREVMVLVHVAGMTHAAAAEALDIPRQTVSDRAAAGRQRLARELDAEASGLPRALCALPLASPPGGWGVATELWTQSALGALGTSVAVATTAAGGLSLMSSKTLIVLTITAALGAGFFGGRFVRPTTVHEDERAHVRSPKLLEANDAQSADPTGVQEAGPRLAVAESDGGAEALRRENERLRARIATLEASGGDARRAAAEAPKTAAQGPTFTFGAHGRLAAVLEANWGEMAKASQAVTASMLEIMEHKRAGTQAPKATYLRVQENVERMRKYEYRTIDKIPSAAKHNGEFTHPITVTNLLATILADAEAPLSEDQIEQIHKLGTAFDQAFAELEARYPDGTLRVQRMLDEYLLKGRFQTDLTGVLTGAQRALVINPETTGIAGLDLYGPTLMILHTSPVLAGKNTEQIRGKLKTLLTQKLKLEEEEAARLEAPLAGWASDIRGLLAPVSPSQARHYTYEQGAEAGRATVLLYARLLKELQLSEEGRQTLLEDHAFYIPRIVRS